MHYYQFNIGDYASHTKGLSLLEDLAYRRLLDEYYLSESPLTGQVSFIARKIGMPDHADCVEYVLSAFFTKTDSENWVNVRADREISSFRLKLEKASNAGKASANARRTNDRSTDVQQAFNGCSTGVQPNKNQEPGTKNQEPILKDISPTEIVDAEASTATLDRVPYQKIIDLYHEVLPELRPVIKINSTRQANIRQRWKNDLPDLDEWRKYFEHVRRSPFLMGKSPPSQGRKVFIADIDFLINGTNAVKIAEGKYHG